MTVVVKDIELNSSEVSGTIATVEVDGTTYRVEQWFTHNSSGTEVYFPDGVSLGADYPDELDDWDMDADPKIALFFDRYRAEVAPLIERIKKEVFSEVDA